MIHIGIDPGLTGAISVLDDNCKIIGLRLMPTIDGKKKVYDIKEILAMVQCIKNTLSGKHETIAMLEAPVIPFGKTKHSTTASTHLCYGAFQGILTALEIPYQIVRPKEWQKVVLKGFNLADTKQASKLFAQRMFPSTDFRRSGRCRNPHDGFTDATCMAYYGYLQNKAITGETNG